MNAAYVDAPDEEVEKGRNILKTQMEAAVKMPAVPREVNIEGEADLGKKAKGRSVHP